MSYGAASFKTIDGKERFAIQTDGAVKAPNNTGSGGSNLLFLNASNGNMYMDVGAFYTQNGYKPGGGSWGSWSDIRLKDVKGSFARGLDEVLRLSPVTYSYKQGNDKNFDSSLTHVGLIAQDVQNVIPEAVEVGEDGYLIINNDPIIWSMLNAIKELKAENDALRERVERLEQGR
jgi:hypothetical protein